MVILSNDDLTSFALNHDHIVKAIDCLDNPTCCFVFLGRQTSEVDKVVSLSFVWSLFWAWSSIKSEDNE